MVELLSTNDGIMSIVKAPVLRTKSHPLLRTMIIFQDLISVICNTMQSAILLDKYVGTRMYFLQ